jgi:penicillin amidase
MRLCPAGKPYLCNDPHLGLNTPSVWAVFHLTSTEEGAPLNVAGATLPGVPGVVIGQNNHIAWGVTNTGIDVQVRPPACKDGTIT